MAKYNLTQSPVFAESGDIFETAPFGEVRGRYVHKGTDIVRHIGYNTTATIVAIAAGRVCAVKNTVKGIDHRHNLEGNYVCIDHGGGIVSKYFHLKYGSIPASVRVGATVKAGDMLGFMGNTGDSYGAHLHFQLEMGGRAIDSAPYLRGEKKIGSSLEGDLAVLVDKGVIQSPDYWRQIAPTVRYLPELIANMARALK